MPTPPPPPPRWTPKIFNSSTTCPGSSSIYLQSFSSVFWKLCECIETDRQRQTDNPLYRYRCVIVYAEVLTRDSTLESRLESHFCDSWLDSSHGPLRLATWLELDPLTQPSHVESRSSHLATGRSWSDRRNGIAELSTGHFSWTRPDPRLPTKSRTRPDPRPDPFPICTFFNFIIFH